MEGSVLYQQVQELYPIMRSITGPGVRESLAKLKAIIPLELKAVRSGEQVLDWVVPKEWECREAYIATPEGTRLIDAAELNLHVVNYSTSVNITATLDELLPHLHTIPEDPDAIPYRTSYYSDAWGFCLSQNQLKELGTGPFKVVIDTTHSSGVLNYGEYVIPGKTSSEILVSTHICHPSLANDNLSGMVLSAALADHLSKGSNLFTWRFVFVPGTIGAITWLEQNQHRVPSIRAGMVLTGLGDTSSFNWKETPAGTHWIDRAVAIALRELHPERHGIIPFSPYGYDERQYCSPGFDLPVGRLTRGIHGTFKEYHTSNDNLAFVSPAGLEEALKLLIEIANTIESDFIYKNLSPYGEPQLGKRGLYGSLGAQNNPGEIQMSMLWLLNQSGGKTSLLQIAEKSHVSIANLVTAARLLTEHGLLQKVRHASEL